VIVHAEVRSFIVPTALQADSLFSGLAREMAGTIRLNAVALVLITIISTHQYKTWKYINRIVIPTGKPAFQPASPPSNRQASIPAGKPVFRQHPYPSSRRRF
jgi:hypothetical protein